MKHVWVKQPSFREEISFKCEVCRQNHFGEIPPEYGCLGKTGERSKQSDLVQDFGFPDVPKQLKIGGKKKCLA